MRIVKLIGTLVLVLAFSAVAVATASAAETLWRWLPGDTQETFTGTSGTITIEIKNAKKTTVTCTKSLTLLTFGGHSSELLENEAKLALGIIHLEKCTIAGLAANSEGDPAGIILMHLEIHNCLIAKGDHGWLIQVLPLHAEIPVVKKLLLIRNAFIGLILEHSGSKLTYELNIKQKEGRQEIEKCEGGTADTLEFAEEGEKFEPGGIEAKEALITFDGPRALQRRRILLPDFPQETFPHPSSPESACRSQERCLPLRFFLRHLTGPRSSVQIRI